MRDAGGDAVQVERVGALGREDGLPAAGGHAAGANGAGVALHPKQKFAQTKMICSRWTLMPKNHTKIILIKISQSPEKNLVCSVEMPVTIWQVSSLNRPKILKF